MVSKTEPEMYEFVCRTADERRVWIQTLRDAIISCSQEGWKISVYSVIVYCCHLTVLFVRRDAMQARQFCLFVRHANLP